MSTNTQNGLELALKRYTEFINVFNKLKLIDYEVDISSFNPTEKLEQFYSAVINDEKLFKYLLNRDKLLFHKKYKLVLIPKINFYNLIDSNIDETLISFVWETVQMMVLIIADSQDKTLNNDSKLQEQITLLLNKLDGLGKKKGGIDIKKISNLVSKIDSSILTEFLTISGLNKIDISSIDVSQFQDVKNITPDKIKGIMNTLGLDKFDVSSMVDKLSSKGDGEKGKEYILKVVQSLIDEYDRTGEKDKTEAILEFAIENAQNKIFDFVENGTLTIYDVISGFKLMKDEKNEELTEKLTKSKLFKDGRTISIKELLAKFTSKLMSQIGMDKATGNISEDQMKSLEEFLKNQTI